MFIPEKNYSFYEENPKGKLTIKKFVKEMYYRLMYDEISLLSANLSYYFIVISYVNRSVGINAIF